MLQGEAAEPPASSAGQADSWADAPMGVSINSEEKASRRRPGLPLGHCEPPGTSHPPLYCAKTLSRVLPARGLIQRRPSLADLAW